MADQISALLEEACGGPLIGMAALFEDSPYLRSEKLREWMGLMMLRPMSKLSPFDFAHWYFRLLRDVVDQDRINALFAAERRRNPRFDGWMSRRDMSTYTVEDLSVYPEDTFGGMFYSYLRANDLSLDLGVELPELRTDFDYWVLRGLQNHDLEHLLSGGGFDIIGEMAPISMRWGSLFRHLDPELAGLLNVPTHLLFLSYLSSTMLYSPAAYPTLQNQMHRGWMIGQTSDAYFVNRLEEFFPLSLADARRRLGIRNADDLDTRAMSDLVMRRPASEALEPLHSA